VTAYYNENDHFAAAWLRELVAANLICRGDVDERSITEVTADDLKGYTQHHFFAGIGVWSYALRQAGWPDDLAVWTGSCPCQGFSASGQREGFDDRRHLWPAWFRLAREFRPDVIFGEQVSSKDGLAWFDTVSADLENEGYAVGALDTCAASVGAPHIRQRLYFVAHATKEGLSLRTGKALLGGQSCCVGKRSGDAGELADATSTRTGQHQSEQERRSPTGAFSVCQLGDSDPARAGTSIESRRRGDAGALANTGSERRQQISGSALGNESSDGREPQGNYITAGHGEGFWSDCEWIPCIDGKSRPTKPLLFPLATGITNRVGFLRGAGNALCAPQAVAFIESYLEIKKGRVQSP
jgi:DNA (cytosine-5)-methyltransferase 1